MRYLLISNRLALGTVQFGLPYGIANQAGQVSRDESARILDRAWAMGIDTLDTASAYGESEQRLGDAGVKQWKIVSKLPAMQERNTDVAAWVHESVLASLKRLRVDSLYGLLLHRSQQLLGPNAEALHEALVALKNQGLVAKFGVSIYSPEELDILWPQFHFDLVQAPYNVLDRRLATSGWLTRLKQAGVEVHVRSVFLQGLLLMTEENRPLAFGKWRDLWQRWRRWLADQALSPLQACLGFALSQAEIDRVLVGVDSLRQLQEIVESCDDTIARPPESLMSVDLDLIDPSRWRTH